MTTTRQRRTPTNTEREQTGNGATTGYEAELWQMADALRGSMDAAEYKHVVLGLIFLKYISDAFEERHAAVLAEWGEDAAEDRDEYTAENIFWVPIEARWSRLKEQARQPTIGQVVDGAMAGIERDNPALKDVLPKDYARPILDKQRLGQLIDLVSNITVGDAEARSKDVLGRVYEYFLSQFASAEGKRGGEFYTPRSVVKLLVEMLEPYQGRVYDPCCGSSGMFVQSMEFIDAHTSGNGNGGSALSDISIYGQESNYTTWRLAKMNLAIRGIEGQIAHGDSFHNDRHPDLKADFILANPPFNISDWGGERLQDDQRWQYGAPPKGNANFAWVQHIVHHLAPTGAAGFVLANGSMSSNQSREGDIRKSLIEAELGGLHGRAARPAFLLDPDTGLPLVPVSQPAQWQIPRPPGRDSVYRREEARLDGGSHPPRFCPRGHRSHRPCVSRVGEAKRVWTTTKMFPAFARVRRWKRSASTAASSLRGATLVPRYRRMMASLSRRRCSGSRRSGGSSRPRAFG